MLKFPEIIFFVFTNLQFTSFQECTNTTLKGSSFLKLLEKANRTETCLKFAIEEFKENYSLKIFAIHSPMLSSTRIVIEHTEDITVHIYDIQSTLNLLKLFGHLIKKLYVSYVDAREYKEINDLIRKKAVKSLTQIHFASFEGNMWIDQKEPFNNVRNLSIGRTIEKRGNETMSLEKLFPYTVQLNLNSIESLDPTFVEHEFPFLVELYIKVAPYKGPYYLRASDFGRFLNENRQIRALDIDDAKIVDYLNGMIYLENIAIKRSFLNSSSFHLLSSISSKYKNLTEVSLVCGADIQEKSLVKFIVGNDKFDRLQLEIYKSIVGEHFNETLCDDWDIYGTDKNSDVVILEMIRYFV